MEMPTGEIEWESDEDFDDEMADVLFCDVCEEDFYSEYSYQQHLSQHKVCGLDGCQYTAHPDLIEKHIESQHLTGLYEKIRSVNTPEEISKWIEERRVKYPSKENVQKRYEMQQEKLKRGEKIGERKNRFGTDKTRLSRVKQKKPARRRKAKVVNVEEKPKSLIDEKCDWNGAMFPFRGTRELYNQEEEKRNSDYDDEEWSLETPTKVSLELNNALGALMGAYQSDEDEAPAEEKIQRQPTEYPQEEPKIPVKEAKRRKSKCKKPNKKVKLDSQKALTTGFNKTKFFKRRVTLLEKLLDSEIRHERNVLLQCVQYVVSNNFFRNNP